MSSRGATPQPFFSDSPASQSPPYSSRQSKWCPPATSEICDCLSCLELLKATISFGKGQSAEQWKTKRLSGLMKKNFRVKNELEVSPKRLKGTQKAIKQTVPDGEGKD